MRHSPYIQEALRVPPVQGYRSAIGSFWNAVVDDLRNKIIHRSLPLFNKVMKEKLGRTIKLQRVRPLLPRRRLDLPVVAEPDVRAANALPEVELPEARGLLQRVHPEWPHVAAIVRQGLRAPVFGGSIRQPLRVFGKAFACHLELDGGILQEGVTICVAGNLTLEYAELKPLGYRRIGRRLTAVSRALDRRQRGHEQHVLFRGCIAHRSGHQ